MGRACAMLWVLFAGSVLARADGVGRPGPDLVAKAVAEVKAEEEAAQVGEALLAAASKARIGQPPIGMKGIPRVGGPKDQTAKPQIKAAPKSTVVKIVQQTRSCAVTLLGKVKARLFGR